MYSQLISGVEFRTKKWTAKTESGVLSFNNRFSRSNLGNFFCFFVFFNLKNSGRHTLAKRPVRVKRDAGIRRIRSVSRRTQLLARNVARPTRLKRCRRYLYLATRVTRVFLWILIFSFQNDFHASRRSFTRALFFYFSRRKENYIIEFPKAALLRVFYSAHRLTSL